MDIVSKTIEIQLLSDSLTSRVHPKKVANDLTSDTILLCIETTDYKIGFSFISDYSSDTPSWVGSFIDTVKATNSPKCAAANLAGTVGYIMLSTFS